MENQEILEHLNSLQKNLKDIESARQMVENTVKAYNGVSSNIDAYSQKLATISEQIKSIIEQISENRLTLSSEIDKKMTTAASKAENASDSFTKQAKETVTAFDKETKSQIQQLNTSAGKILADAKAEIEKAKELASSSISQSTNALNSATEAIKSSTEVLITKMETSMAAFEKKVSKKINIGTAVVIILLLIILAISAMRAVGMVH